MDFTSGDTANMEGNRQNQLKKKKNRFKKREKQC